MFWRLLTSFTFTAFYKRCFMSTGFHSDYLLNQYSTKSVIRDYLNAMRTLTFKWWLFNIPKLALAISIKWSNSITYILYFLFHALQIRIRFRIQLINANMIRSFSLFFFYEMVILLNEMTLETVHRVVFFFSTDHFFSDSKPIKKKQQTCKLWKNKYGFFGVFFFRVCLASWWCKLWIDNNF